MNLLEDIYKNLVNKDYDELTKIRWIYLYLCEMFAYDTRYLYSCRETKEKIYNTKIDVANTEEFEVVCYTLSRILADILTEFGYKAEIRLTTNEPLTHAFVVVTYKDDVLKLDPTKRHDITRVKINNDTRDFNSLSQDQFFSEKLMNIDKNIAPDFNDLYFTTKSVANIACHTLQKVYEYANANNLTNYELFLKKLEAIYEMINARDNLKYYDDVDFYYSYLLKTFNINSKEIMVDGKLEHKLHYYVKPVILFNVDDPTMKDIINISCVQYEDSPMKFYLLKKDEESYKVREIFKDETLEILNQYEAPLCQYMMLQNAKKLSTGKQVGK